mgnify:FL=1
MPQVIWDEAAIQDLDHIWDHIGTENGNPVAADRFIDSIRDRSDAYARQPEMGTSWSELAPRIRFFVVGNYVVIYRPDTTGIQVARVSHGARDIQSVFNESRKRS